MMVAQLCKPFPSYADDCLRFSRDHASRIVHAGDRFSHADADNLAHRAEHVSVANRVIIDLTNAGEADTSAFARLVLLRRSLLRNGRDLTIVGLRDQARGLFEVNRLESVLPSLD